MKITLLTGKTYNIEQQIDFPIKIVKSPRAKKLTLRIDTREHLPVLSIPRYCPQKKAVEFVLAHKQWINDSLNRLPCSKPFENGDTISLFGKEVTIVHAPKRRLGAKLETDQLLVSGEIEFLHRRVKDFIKKKAQNEFYKRSNKYAKKLGETINGVTIKRYQIALGQLLNPAKHQLQLAHCSGSRFRYQLPDGARSSTPPSPQSLALFLGLRRKPLPRIRTRGTMAQRTR